MKSEFGQGSITNGQAEVRSEDLPNAGIRFS